MPLPPSVRKYWTHKYPLGRALYWPTALLVVNSTVVTYRTVLAYRSVVANRTVATYRTVVAYRTAVSYRTVSGLPHCRGIARVAVV